MEMRRDQQTLSLASALQMSGTQYAMPSRMGALRRLR